jgi:hypothetical protein
LKDHKTILLQKLVALLAPIGLPVLSIIPDSHPKPFIFIGEIESDQSGAKGNFVLTGGFVVELYTGSQEWTGSLEQPLKWSSDIKEALQPVADNTIDIGPDFQMVFLKMGYDSGLIQYDTANRYFNNRIQYEYIIKQL